MKLVSLTVENFRSIIAAKRIPISQVTTLIGPNNEGKSNILRALAIGVNTLVSMSPRRRGRFHAASIVRRRRREFNEYRWSSDYPLDLQNSRPNKSSNITLEFELSALEIEEFEQRIGSKLNGALPIAISFGRVGEPGISIAKQGRGQKILNSKASEIAEFISEKLELQYIPAVRTAQAAQAIVDELVAAELSRIEDDPLYMQAIDEITRLQEPILEELSRSIAVTMQNFLPQIRGVRISIPPQSRNFALRATSEIWVNDGAETLLEYKGDGVQSLAALAIMRHASQAQHAKKEVIIALEEPESHLHPRAIRELKLVLEDVALQHQVVITTHNPLFANRTDVASNVIVRNNRAVSARNIRQVRDALGVRLEDNLTSAVVVLLVEGEEDRIALRSILSEVNSNLNGELRSGRLAIDVLNGASNLSHRARLHGDTLCRVHAFLDNDAAGRRAFNEAKDRGILVVGDVNFAMCGGKQESELEDLYLEDVYQNILRQEAGLQFQRHGPDKDRKWTERVSNLLRSCGKPRDDATLLAIKVKVAKVAGQLGIRAVHPQKLGPIHSLANHLEQKLVAGD